MERVGIDLRRTAQDRLPTALQRYAAAAEELVAANVRVRDFTHAAIAARAGVSPNDDRAAARIYRAARARLGRGAVAPVPPPAGLAARQGPAGWIRLDANEWDLRPWGLHTTLRRADLPEPVRELGWELLRAEMERPDLAVGTVAGHFRSMRWLSALFAHGLPTLQLATVADLQRALIAYGGSEHQRKRARQGLLRLLDAHAALAERSGNSERLSELTRMSGWLSSAQVRRPLSSEVFLTRVELDAVIAGCLADISAGLAFDPESDLITASTRSDASGSAAAIVNWAGGLVVLTTAVTGLRRESVLELGVDDFADIRPGVAVLAWRHRKKQVPEEKIAVLPGFVAQHLATYIERTAGIRAHIGTDRLFLAGGGQGEWVALRNAKWLFDRFVARHGLRRGAQPLPLGNNVLRRTFVTRALAEGRSIWAIAAQLGHDRVETTLGYAKFERYEHPGQVGAALDEMGRLVLHPWDTPQRLENLSAEERERLLNDGARRDQHLGLCRHESCVKAEAGAPPPCGMCEHLVSGPQFAPAWQAERQRRVAELVQLRSDALLGAVSASATAQLHALDRNWAYLSGEDDS